MYWLPLAHLVELAKKGNAVCQYELAERYHTGSEVPENHTLAMNWYRKSATNGFAKAQHRVGLFILCGRAPALDATEGMRWLRKAAQQGESGAQSFLGQIYLHGTDGLPKNLKEAHVWLNLAGTAKSAGAEQAFAACESAMTSKQIMAATKLARVRLVTIKAKLARERTKRRRQQAMLASVWRKTIKQVKTRPGAEKPLDLRALDVNRADPVENKLAREWWKESKKR